jgi:hypothetical protein
MSGPVNIKNCWISGFNPLNEFLGHEAGALKMIYVEVRGPNAEEGK